MQYLTLLYDDPTTITGPDCPELTDDVTPVMAG